VELESHDVLFAEGSLSETYVDDDNRLIFQNASEYYRLYPQPASQRKPYCAPRVCDGYELEAVRRRLASRAELYFRVSEVG
jgi:O-antigen biosynthesis protein